MAGRTRDDAGTADKAVPEVMPDHMTDPSEEARKGTVALAGKLGEIAQRNEAHMQTFVTWLTERANTTDEDQYNIMSSVIAEIMTSNNVAELMAERSPMHGRDMVGVPLILHGFEIREGDYEESIIGFYAALTVSRPGSEETRVVTCGGTKVMAKLYKLEEFGEWPQAFFFTEKKTRKGYGVLDIVRPDGARV